LRSGESRRDLESALGRITIREKTGGKKLGALASRYGNYELPLYPSLEGTSILKVSVNQASTLRLILDTGARGIVVSAAAARSLGLRDLVQASLDGAGDTVRIGDLIYRNCPIHVSGRSLTEHADGVIGSVIFQQFEINLDFADHTLNLIPFAEGQPRLSGEEEDWTNWDRRIPDGMEQFVPISQVGSLILVPTRIKGAGGGYFILDTGASFSSVSKIYPFALQFANRTFTDPALLAQDLKSISNREGIEISGIIGCPMLAHSNISIDYRDGLLGIQDSH